MTGRTKLLSCLIPLMLACSPAPSPPCVPTEAGSSSSAPPTASASGRMTDDRVVAKWAGGQLTYGELLKTIQPELEAEEKRRARGRYQLERSALQESVAKAIVEQAAKAEGKTLEAYLDGIRAGVQVSDADVAAFYKENIEPEEGAPPLEELEQRIRDHLTEERSGAAIRSKIEALQKEAGLALELAPPKAALANIDIAGRPSIGPDSAAVTVVVFEDFECPFCADSRKTLKAYRDAYPDKVRVVFMHYPLDMHPAARDAAAAAECGHQQGKFWPMYEAIFAKSSELKPGAAAMRPMAVEVGLDLPKFDACMADDKTRERVSRDIAEGDDAGVEGTPSVFVNGLAADGVPSPDQLASYF